MIAQNVFDLLKPMPPFIRLLREANCKGLKTQTRRVMRPQPPIGWIVDELANGWSFYHRRGDMVWEDTGKFMCRYGKAHDLRYMREPLFKGPFDYAHYVDDKTAVFSVLTGEPIKWRWKVDTLSQLYMPKEAARTFKRYKFIRVQRLQEISEESCIAEGVHKTPLGFFEIQLPDEHAAGFIRTTSARGTFDVFWDAINAKRGYPWRANWWVWVIGYESYEVSNAS